MNILKNKYFILGNILLLLAVIPLTLFIVKRQTDLRSKAAPSSNLSFTPSTATASIGETITEDIMIDPGQNVVSIVEMTIQVDPAQLEIISLEADKDAFPLLFKGPTIDNSAGTAQLSVSTSNDVGKAIQQPTKVATLTLKAKAATSGAPSVVKFTTPSSQVFSIATSDGVVENVLNNTGTASVTISSSGDNGGGGSNPPGGGGGSGGGSSGGSSSTGLVCSGLTIDKAANGVAPYSINFNAAGSVSSASATISKVVFNFGDGTVNEATESGRGGLGTNTVNLQIAHTYNNPGTYKATAILTDSKGNSTDAALCTRTITVVGQPTATPTSSPANAGGASQPTPTLPVTGTVETTLAVVGGVAITLAIGFFLFIL